MAETLELLLKVAEDQFRQLASGNDNGEQGSFTKGTLRHAAYVALRDEGPEVKLIPELVSELREAVGQMAPFPAWLKRQTTQLDSIDDRELIQVRSVHHASLVTEWRWCLSRVLADIMKLRWPELPIDFSHLCD